jgi:hypothetical protein
MGMRLRGAFKERWEDVEGAEKSLQGRLEVSKERWRDEEGQRGRNLQGETER